MSDNDSDKDEENDNKFLVGHIGGGKRVLSGDIELAVSGRSCEIEDDENRQAHCPEYQKPNYETAMEYWNTLLPRRIKDKSQPSGYRQALIGELYDEQGETAELYDFFNTDSNALDEFGIVKENEKNQHNAGLFGDAGYEQAQEDIGTCEISFDENSKSYVFDRNTTLTKLPTHTNLLGSVYGATPQSLDVNKQAAADLIVFFIFLVFVIISKRLEMLQIEKIDVAQQTTKDYSVVVENPPPDCTSEQEYYRFFSKFGEVVTLTVALKNGGLIKTIADRKELSMKVDSMRKFEAMKTAEELNKEESRVDRIMKFLGMDLESLQTKLDDLDKKILAMSDLDYPPWRVFVSFNKEEEQRRCLVELAEDYSVNVEKREKLQFCGHLLQVKEAPEPGDVIYEHSHRQVTEKIVRFLISYSLTALVVVFVSWVIGSLQSYQSRSIQLIIALFISGMNSSLPLGIRMLTQMVEPHDSDTSYQRSVLAKLIIARCMNSAVLIYVLTPWEEQFSLENMRQLQIILLSDSIISPFLRYLSLYDAFKRHVLAPILGKTQADYNAQFQGVKWTLAERYTDALKSIFTGFFFAVPLPTGLFISSFAMMTTYLCDKYSLFRLWERRPTVDHTLSKITRYFLIGTLWTHVYISMKYFANWPYSYAGLEVEESCENNCDNCPKRSDDVQCDFVLFLCKPKSFMPDSQQQTVLIYMVLSLLFGILCLLYFIFLTTRRKVKTNIEKQEASEIPLREVYGAPAYVPTVKLKQMLAPFVFSDTSQLPARFNPIRSTDVWDESVDAKLFSLVDASLYPGISQVKLKAMFSTTTFYPEKDLFKNLMPQSDDEDNIEEREHEDDEVVHNRITAEDFSSSSFLNTNDLPSGWERRVTKDGRIFYVDHNDMRITHVAPPVVKVGSISHDSAESLRILTQNSAKRLSLQKRNSGRQVLVKDMSSRKALMRNQSIRSLHTEGLPLGWEQRVTEDGRVYYVDHNAKETHWILPGSGINRDSYFRSSDIIKSTDDQMSELKKSERAPVISFSRPSSVKRKKALSDLDDCSTSSLNVSKTERSDQKSVPLSSLEMEYNKNVSNELPSSLAVCDENTRASLRTSSKELNKSSSEKKLLLSNLNASMMGDSEILHDVEQEHDMDNIP